jgi:hypothetical protein
VVYIGLLFIALFIKGNNIKLRSLIYKYILNISLLTFRNYIKAINNILFKNK